MPQLPDPPPPKGGLRRLLSKLGERGEDTATPGKAVLTTTHRRVSASTPSAVEVAAPPVDAAAATAALMRLFSHAHRPEELLDAFASGMASLHGELGDMGRRLRVAHDAGDWPGYGRALRQLIDKYIRTIDVADPLAAGRTQAEYLRDLLRHALGNALATLLQRTPDLVEEAQSLGTALRHWRPGQDLGVMETRLRELTHQIGLRADDANEQQNLLLGLFDLLLENVGELIDERSWLQGQIGMVRQLIAGPMDAPAIEQARGTLREVIYKQGLLKQGIAESKQAMREMMVSFVDRLGGMATSTGEYHDRVAGYTQAIGDANSIAELNRLLQEVLDDTAGMQAEAASARDVLLNAQQQVQAAEARIQALEQELKDVAGLVREDQLTGALNRRGFEELFEREVARTQRSSAPLCVAMLDLDDFRKLNETHGHAGGDAALRHVVEIARATLRATDAIARFGGEEFVLLLPDATIFEGSAAVTRLQRALAQHSFLHEDMRVFVTFSAGVALRKPDEAQDVLLKRADRAMYEAKKAGKNRVLSAD
ncbi:GGDEF domain-containing protein [Pseudoxanthomonas sp. JBR18]|uniref:GGDEF domain-containing protein n=1 Tax=Pseudoxanthomonas sp. JBR18 TaxID=2969308 RepID=UPI0023051B38|nr:GGDEF domain-containing protein [Pseudoxanthomonas sp. JBR18]WCE04878.1 GGDEF domain-containing protein [Pseudoxanthomonas sp. JBR18]